MQQEPTPSVPRPRTISRWRRWHRHAFTREKISRPVIHRFASEWATEERALVLHPEEGIEFFPNRVVMSERAGDRPDIATDYRYRELGAIESESFSVVVCMGLLEHIAEPEWFVGELHRILKPGGRVLVACSSCFSVHEGPDDYFHYTPYGLKVLFRTWSRFEMLRGSCGPFRTIGILLQRIHLQCELFPPLRPLVEVAFHLVPLLDRFVVRQYDAVGTSDPARVCDSMLPSNIHAVVVK
jgi:SAM-dependent methyltransferase